MQRHWQDLCEGQPLAPVHVPLTVARLVMAAGANRDFNGIHHNVQVARAGGAPDIYANTYFLQGMWERCVRDFIGPAGDLIGLRGFAMRKFNTAGSTVTVEGRVERRWRDGDAGMAEIALWSHCGGEVTVGPGKAIVRLPMRAGD